jgi:hypothetical protein
VTLNCPAVVRYRRNAFVAPLIICGGPAADSANHMHLLVGQVCLRRAFCARTRHHHHPGSLTLHITAAFNVRSIDCVQIR